jgi:hypothetical protein
MLDLARATRKDSLRDRANSRGGSELLLQMLELPVHGLVEEGLSRGGWQARVPEQGIPDAPPEAPARVPRDGLQGRRPDARLGRRLEDVGLGREAVIQEGGDDPDVRVLPDERKHPAARAPGKVHALRDRQVRQATEKFPVRGPADQRMHPDIRRKACQISPEQGFDERESLDQGSVSVSSEGEPDCVKAAGLGASENSLHVRRRKNRSAELSEEPSLGAH